MIHALGFCHDKFKLNDPGRLCRGRERWIQPWPLEAPLSVHRLVISGAAFSDDSARDAVRGINHSKVNLAAIIAALFPKEDLYSFTEDGHPADIPDETDDLEVYVGYRAGGQQSEPMVRWRKRVKGAEAIGEALGDDHELERVRGFAVLSKEVDLSTLSDLLYELTGMSTVDSPPARFQPAALETLLTHVHAMVLLHRDKHGPSLGVYSSEPIETDGRLDPLCEETETLLVPFAIPPMLARWDRALAEMKASWEADRQEPFPVPESGEPSRWDSRGRRRNRKRGRGKKSAAKEESARTDGNAPAAETSSAAGPDVEAGSKPPESEGSPAAEEPAQPTPEPPQSTTDA